MLGIKRSKFSHLCLNLSWRKDEIDCRRGLRTPSMLGLIDGGLVKNF